MNRIPFTINKRGLIHRICADGEVEVNMAAEAAALPPDAARPDGRLARVTRAVKAATTGFTFLRGLRGGEVVARRNTLIALDGEADVQNPHDDRLRVMPSPQATRGHTTVRPAHLEA